MNKESPTPKPATPLPWRYEYTRDNCATKQQMQDEPIGGSIMSDETHIARIWSDTESPVDNAAYIVTACNAFPELVEALRSVISWRDAVTRAQGELACAKANRAGEETAAKRLNRAVDGDSDADERVRSLLARIGGGK